MKLVHQFHLSLSLFLTKLVLSRGAFLNMNFIYSLCNTKSWYYLIIYCCLSKWDQCECRVRKLYFPFFNKFLLLIVFQCNCTVAYLVPQSESNNTAPNAPSSTSRKATTISAGCKKVLPIFGSIFSLPFLLSTIYLWRISFN